MAGSERPTDRSEDRDHATGGRRRRAYDRTSPRPWDALLDSARDRSSGLGAALIFLWQALIVLLVLSGFFGWPTWVHGYLELTESRSRVETLSERAGADDTYEAMIQALNAIMRQVGETTGYRSEEQFLFAEQSLETTESEWDAGPPRACPESDGAGEAEAPSVEQEVIERFCASWGLVGRLIGFEQGLIDAEEAIESREVRAAWDAVSDSIDANLATVDSLMTSLRAASRE